MKYDNTKEALAAIYKQFGADVLLGKLNAYLQDFAPSVPENYKKLAYAVHTFGSSDVLKANIKGSKEDKERAFKIAVRNLTDHFISKKIAEDIVLEFTDALGWKIAKPVQPQPEQKPVSDIKPVPVVKSAQTQPAQKTSSTPVIKPQPVNNPQPVPAAKPKHAPVVKPQPAPAAKPQPVNKPQPKQKQKPKFQLPSFFKSIFTIVDRDSGDGSYFLFGILGAGVGISIGTIIGGFFSAIIGGILGWIIVSELIGKIIHVNIGKVFIIYIIGAILLAIAANVIVLVSSFFKSKTEVMQTAAVTTRTATVIADNLSMYEGTSLEGEAIKIIMRGDTVSVLGEVENDWANIKHGRDLGYVSSKYIIIAGDQSERIQAEVLINGTYTFWPRLQALRDGSPLKNIFIPQITVSDNSVIIYFCANSQGVYGPDLIVNDWDIIWDSGVDGFYNSEYFTLYDSEDPSQVYKPAQANSTNNGMGKIWSLTFNNLTSTRFKLTGKQYFTDQSDFIFDEIIMSEPDNINKD